MDIAVGGVTVYSGGEGWLTANGKLFELLSFNVNY